MIDLQREIGDQVVFVGPLYEDVPVPIGTVGVIEWVDDEDPHITYMVKFPSPDWGLWIGNDRLALHSDLPIDTEHCGWRDRALKAEAEIKELKKALATLSEG